MVNSQINKEIHKAKLAYGHSLIEEAYKDFHNWTRNRSNEHNINRGVGSSRETEVFECDICGKEFIELDSLRTPAYLRFRTHRWRCEQKAWEKDLENFKEEGIE
jgi:hypothetical protein